MFKKSQELFKTIASFDLPNCFALKYKKKHSYLEKVYDVTYFKDGNRLGKRKQSMLGKSFKKKFMEHDFSKDKKESK